MSMIGSSLLNEVVVENGTTDAGAILDSLKDGVIRSLKQKGAAFEARDGMDVALCVWDKRTSEVNYAGANNPLYHITEGELNVVIPDKMACGWEPDATGTFRSHTIQAKPGDWFYIFSDGYVDQFGGPKGKKFKAAQLKALLMKSHTLPPQRQLEVLDQTIENWRGELEQIDDICFIGFAT